MRRLVLAALLCAAVPAAAQGVPEALRGTWAAGSCAAPTALLHVTARSVARLLADGPARLVRFRALRDQDQSCFMPLATSCDQRSGCA